jgi:hypothetical protein
MDKLGSEEFLSILVELVVFALGLQITQVQASVYARYRCRPVGSKNGFARLERSVTPSSLDQW